MTTGYRQAAALNGEWLHDAGTGYHSDGDNLRKALFSACLEQFPQGLYKTDVVGGQRRGHAHKTRTKN